MRFLIPSVCLLVAALNPITPSAQSSATTCSIAGTITSGRTPLPGVVVSVLDGDGRAVDVSASGVDGAYGLRIPGAGRYTLKAEFVAFSTVSREALDRAGKLPGASRSHDDARFARAEVARSIVGASERRNRSAWLYSECRRSAGSGANRTAGQPRSRRRTRSGRCVGGARSGTRAAIPEPRASRRSGRPRAHRRQRRECERLRQSVASAGRILTGHVYGIGDVDRLVAGERGILRAQRSRRFRRSLRQRP